MRVFRVLILVHARDENTMMKSSPIRQTKARPNAGHHMRGVVMLEALIAVLIFSMGILAIVGLQAAMVKNTSEAKYRAEATFIAQQKLGEMWANVANHDALNGYVIENEDISNLLPDGRRIVELTAAPECQVTVTVQWQLPGEEIHRHRTSARLNSVLNDGLCTYLI